MAVTPKKLYGINSVPTGATTAYTVPASTTTIVKNIVISNYTTASVAVTILIGGVTIVPAVPINGNSVTTLDVSVVMAATETISVLAATASSIALHISGVEVV